MNTQVYLSQILRSCEVESLQRRANELEKRLIPHMEAEVKLRNDFGLSVLPDTYILMSLKREYNYCVNRIKELNSPQEISIPKQIELEDTHGQDSVTPHDLNPDTPTATLNAETKYNE